MGQKHINISRNGLQLNLFDEQELTEAESAFGVHPVIAEGIKAISERERAASVERGRPHGRMVFMSFGSGSSGNCAYIGDDCGGIIIDAGVALDIVEKGLRANGIDPLRIGGIILTHDHSDHIRYVYQLVRRYKHLRIFCTPRVLEGILRRHNISRRVKDFHTPIYKEFPFNPVPGFEVTAFEVSHDGSDNAGFFIRNLHNNISLGVTTDLGCITPRVDHYLRQANHLMIESNYDATMLATGHYPAYLKARIAADRGHLDNVVTARFLADVVPGHVNHIFLCHLSQDNNEPEIALDTVRHALLQAGIPAIGDGTGRLGSRECPVQLVALPRHEASQLYVLD